MKKKKKGFTLVELLAVIVILAIILVIAVPQIMNVIKSARLSSIKDSAILIAEEAEKDLLTQQVLNKDYSEATIPCSDVAKLNDDYASCKIIYNNGIATVKLKGAANGKFAGISCKGTKDNMNCKESDGTIKPANNEDAEVYLASILDEETTSTTCDGTGGLIEVTHENGDVDYRYVGACPNNYATFNGETPQVTTVYQMYADGDITTNAPRFNGGNGYSTKDDCEGGNGLSGNFESMKLEGDTPAICVLNTTTNKYYIEAHGFLTGAGSYGSQSDCENAYSSQGMKSSSAPSGLSCRTKQVVKGGWRVIGVFDAQKTLTGSKERRVKLVRNESLGNYSWDSSASGVNEGWGVNEWSQADLKTELNGDYLNSSLSANTTWYNGANNKKTATFDISKVLKSTAQSLIDEVVWYTGASIPEEVSLSTQYSNERGNTTGKTCTSGTECNDTVTRTTKWVGKVGLIYPSDYAYASEDTVCANNLGYTGEAQGEYPCNNKNWLSTVGSEWTITPDSSQYKNYNYAESIDNRGFVTKSFTGLADGVRPSLYLTSGILISGEGTVENPYVFSK